MTRSLADLGASLTGMLLRFEHGRVVETSATDSEAWLDRCWLRTIVLVPAHNRLSELELSSSMDSSTRTSRHIWRSKTASRESCGGTSAWLLRNDVWPAYRPRSCTTTLRSGPRDRRVGSDEGRPGWAAHGWRRLALAVAARGG